MPPFVAPFGLARGFRAATRRSHGRHDGAIGSTLSDGKAAARARTR